MKQFIYSVNDCLSSNLSFWLRHSKNLRGCFQDSRDAKLKLTDSSIEFAFFQMTDSGEKIRSRHALLIRKNAFQAWQGGLKCDRAGQTLTGQVKFLTGRLQFWQEGLKSWQDWVNSDKWLEKIQILVQNRWQGGLKCNRKDETLARSLEKSKWKGLFLSRAVVQGK